MEVVLALAPIPLSENYGADAESARRVKRFPVDLYMCRQCGHVQHLDVIDSQSLWANYTYYSGDSKGMPEHFATFAADVLRRYSIPPGSLVVDIGSNDGSLLKPFKAAGHRVIGIDPAEAIARMATDAGIPTVPELLSLELARKLRAQHGPAHVVCMFNAFAHADNMDEVADAIREMLAPEGLFFFEAQYLLDIVDRLLIATIFHEHMSHHSVAPLVPFLARHGLQLVEIQCVPIQHGSIIGAVQLADGSHRVGNSVAGLLRLESERRLAEIATLREFAARVGRLRNSTMELVRAWRAAEIDVAGYGAARSGPTLIAQLGLTGAIHYIFDDHPQKVGKYSPGDGIPIVPTAELLRRMPPYVVILAWVHAEKIISSNQEYLRKGGRFVVLCPETRVVGAEGDIPLANLKVGPGNEPKPC